MTVGPVRYRSGPRGAVVISHAFRIAGIVLKVQHRDSSWRALKISHCAVDPRTCSPSERTRTSCPSTGRSRIAPWTLTSCPSTVSSWEPAFVCSSLAGRSFIAGQEHFIAAYGMQRQILIPGRMLHCAFRLLGDCVHGLTACWRHCDCEPSRRISGTNSRP